MSTSFQDLYKSAAENYLLSGDVLNSLRLKIGFSEIRIYCTKPYHGRINHAKFSNTTTALFNYAVDFSSSSFPPNLCNALQYMPDDNSVTKAQPCSSLSGTPSYTNQRLYNHIWHVVGGSSQIAVWTPLRMECDDPGDNVAEYNNFGTWLFHVR